MTLPPVSEIELACLKAWPALEEQRHGNWVARFANGYTKRANSVQSLDLADDTDAVARITAIAADYTRRGLHPTFRMTPLAGPGIAAALDDMGWTPFEESLVLGMELRKVARPVAALTKYFEPADPDWLQLQAALSGYDAATTETLGHMLGRITVPARGIVVYDDTSYEPVGAALAVNADGIAIFLNVVVDAAWRGHGFGRAAMHAALNWTSQSGATQAAIQVLADNAAAVSLYRSLGFDQKYAYHYRRAPL